MKTGILFLCPGKKKPIEIQWAMRLIHFVMTDKLAAVGEIATLNKSKLTSPPARTSSKTFTHVALFSLCGRINHPTDPRNARERMAAGERSQGILSWNKRPSCSWVRFVWQVRTRVSYRKNLNFQHHTIQSWHVINTQKYMLWSWSVFYSLFIPQLHLIYL